MIIPVLTQHYAMLQRNLLYTGVTRSKKLVVLVGQKKAIAIAVRNVSGRKRWSKSASGCGQNRLSHDSSAGELSMVAEDLFAGPVRQWLDGVEPTWTLLALRGLWAVQWR